MNTTLVYEVGYFTIESIKGIYSAILGYLFFHNHITDERTFDADAKALNVNVCYIVLLLISLMNYFRRAMQ